MQLVFTSRRGVATVDWSEYALLRDNVQHYLESPGRPRYHELHAIEHAVDGVPSQVNALGLRRELQSAWAALAALTVAECAVSLRTRAFVTGCGCAPPVRGTVLARFTGWSLPLDVDDTPSLRARLSGFAQALLTITGGAAPTDDVSVVRAAGPEYGMR